VDNAPGNSVSVVDTATGASRRVTLPARPFDGTVTPDGSSAWITTASPAGLWRIPLDAG
jgi:hypothetical protein